jgi:hypothetical protein
MPAQPPEIKEHLHYHKDGSLWAKGQTIGDAQTGYWSGSEKTERS